MDRIRALTRGPKHHFFGYYGVSPWSPSRRRHLALETDFHERRPGPADVAAVGLVDAASGAFTPLAHTSAFNLQQGSMLHWIDAGFGAEFTYNDWTGAELVSRAVNPETGSSRTNQAAIAAVSPTEPVAIGLNYVRMFRCRAVVGYAIGEDPRSLTAQPEDDGLYRIDLASGNSHLILSIADVVRAHSSAKIRDAMTWFNHVLFNTDGSRLFFFCRVRRAQKWLSSLWSVNPDGSDLDCQIPYGYTVSHFEWFDAQRIIVSSNVLDGTMQFVAFSDGKRDFRPFGAGVLPPDGHLCFSPDRRWAVCDTYPQGPERLAELMLYHVEENRNFTLGRFHHPERFRGDIRCDLHPRWRPDGTAVTFDSVHEGSRQIYLADVADLIVR